MSVRKNCLTALAASAVLLSGFSLRAADTSKKPTRDLASFGTLQSPTPEAARAQAQDWFKSVGKTDEASLKAFAAIWDADRTLIEKVTDTLILGDANAARLMTEVRDQKQPAPTSTPAMLKDVKVNPYLRANLALAYARELSNRRVFEECLEAMKSIKPELVVDPATFYFHKAVTEHTLMLRKEADESISRLLDDVTDAPERYRQVAALMLFDMLAWQDNDLGWIARKMNVIRDRLDLTRGGKKTQQMQKEVLVRLDEMIKELENKAKQPGSGAGNGGNCPPGSPSQPGGPPSGNQSSGPAGDSALPSAPPKAGIADKQMDKLKDIVNVWGKLSEKERANAMVELTKDMPAKYRESIEIYLKQISARSAEINK
jgi:hypothetical protein